MQKVSWSCILCCGEFVMFGKVIGIVFLKAPNQCQWEQLENLLSILLPTEFSSQIDEFIFFSFWNRQICQCKNEYIQNTVVGNTSVCIGTIPCGVDERVNFAAIFLVNNFKRFSRWKIWLQQNARMRLNQFSNKLCQCWSWAYFCISCNTFHK